VRRLSRRSYKATKADYSPLPPIRKSSIAARSINEPVRAEPGQVLILGDKSPSQVGFNLPRPSESDHLAVARTFLGLGAYHVGAGGWCSGNRLGFDAKCTCRRSSRHSEPGILHARSILRGEVFGLRRRDVGPRPWRDRRGDRGSAALPWGHACPIRAGCPLDRALMAAPRSADDLGLAFVTPRYEQLPARLPRWLALRAEA
jgi:hypothetical protein